MFELIVVAAGLSVVLTCVVALVFLGLWRQRFVG